ncbi:phage tail protein [Peribacillus frigoritolerans]|nr:phage tail protein [Peribacillus frigoritolerans]
MALVGLDNIYVAPLTKDDGTGVTYGTPVKIANAIDAKITPSQDQQSIFADDNVAEIITVFSQVDVEFTIAELSNSIYKLLLGKTTNSQGVIIDKADDVAPYFAFGFRAKKSNGSYRHVWLYKGKFTLIEEGFQTQADKADFTTQPIKGTFVKRANDGKYRARVDSDDAGVTAGVITGWFTSVYNVN